jgi:hypothetical protein
MKETLALGRPWRLEVPPKRDMSVPDPGGRVGIRINKSIKTVSYKLPVETEGHYTDAPEKIHSISKVGWWYAVEISTVRPQFITFRPVEGRMRLTAVVPES